MKTKRIQIPILTLVLMILVTLTSCKQVPEEHAASDKYRLVWNDDPTSTITIIWDQLGGEQSAVLFGKKDFGRKYWKYPNKQTPTRKLIDYYQMNTCYAKLENLQPAQTYYFVIKDSVGVSNRFYFHTASDKPKAFTFITGGDTKSVSPSLEAGRASNTMVAKLRPLFVLFNGDFTTGNGTNPERWHQWLIDWDSLTTTSDGRKIPIVPVHGNHENGNKSILNKIFDAPFQHGDSTNIYYSLSFGDKFFHIITLNSEIDEGGSQREWLKADLEDHKDFCFKIAGYHKPFSPHTSKKKENDYQYDQWAGLFYDFGLDLAIEADSHMHKITYPLKPSNDEYSHLGFVRDDDKGTMYIGEGSWGAKHRPNNDDKPWTFQSGSFNQIKWIHVKPEETDQPASIEIFTVITSQYDEAGNQTFFVDEVESLTKNNTFKMPENINLFHNSYSPKSVKYPFHLNPGSQTIFVFSKKKSELYRYGWIDLNKNGVKDVYEDRNAFIEKRIDDLLAQMTLEEKTCQMATLYGYKRVLMDDLPTPEWKNEIWKDGIGAIDEHLNGFAGFGKPPVDNDNQWPPSKHARALNEVQRFFIEETRLGIPVDFTNEGIRGVESVKATGFPTQLGIGHTWNRDLVNKIGKVTANEARALGYTNIYAPILDVGRDQRWGRMEEVYGESPFLVAELGIAMVKGMQEKFKVASTAKHFAIYSENKGAREGMARVDPRVPLREAHYIFLYPFKRVIQEAGILGIMSSYNDYDGIPISGSEYYLTELLREKYGFKGYVVSDSDALEYLQTKHRTASDYKEAVLQAIGAGMNVRCTFTHPKKFIEPLRELVEEGRLSMDVIDDRVRDVLRVKYLIGLFDFPYVENPAESDRIVNNKKNREIALQTSRESIVLLKNQDNLLPLAKNIGKVAVCGPNANDPVYALTHYGPLGWDVVTVLDGIQDKIGKENVFYTKGCDLVDANWPNSEILPEPLTDSEKAEIQKAVENAQEADVAIVVVGGSVRTCGENKSRSGLNLPGRQLDLVKAIYNTGTPTVVVLINGRPLTINWTDRNVPAVIEAWYPGVYGGTAVADVLFGDYNPGGKLTVTFPKTVGQIPMNFPSKPNAQIDARGNNIARVKGLLYPFGFGLSYTTFKYSKLKIAPENIYPSANVTVSCDITNTGKIPGDEIIQLYIRDVVSSVTTYEKNLRGFERIHLNPGETKTVTFSIKPEHLLLLDKDMNWVIEPGEFKVMIGSSSEDIRLEGKFVVQQ